MLSEMEILDPFITAAQQREAHNHCAKDVPCAVKKMNLRLLLQLQLLLQLKLLLHHRAFNAAIPYQVTARANTTMQSEMGIWVIFITAALREAHNRCAKDAPYAVKMMNLNLPQHFPLQLIT